MSVSDVIYFFSILLSIAPCSINFTAPGGYIETPPRGSYDYSNFDCTYTVTVYMGYGVEIQVGDLYNVSAILTMESEWHNAQFVIHSADHFSDLIQAHRHIHRLALSFSLQNSRFLKKCAYPIWVHVK